MRDNYEFSNARKNPFAGTFKGEYTVIIERNEHKEVVKLDYNKTPPAREILEVIPNSHEVIAPLKKVSNI
ncbi:MAG: hypothetical protein FWB91_02160 [Defluviitaleaceae bacterium]|nr:hypothetical protein [Defluviitaleaceae bacterium]